jgi:Protein of unknown function (DUF1634)
VSAPVETAGTLERTVGRVLRTGIGATTVCLSGGLALKLMGISHRPAELLLTIGLMLLLATPVARVVVSVVDYARERNWVFFGLTVIVLAELAASVLYAIYAGRT